MDVDAKNRWKLRAQNALFVVLLFAAAGLLAWLSHQHRVGIDWTAGGRNTLTAESAQLLDALQGPVEIVAFVPDDNDVHERITKRIAMYRRHKPDISLRFVNPDLNPEIAQQMGVIRPGQLVLRQDERSAKAEALSERELGRALALLARTDARWAVFLEGHGEHSLHDESGRGYAQFGALLLRSGFNVTSLSLVRSPAIPDNTTVLVIAGPQDGFTPGEAALVREYVEQGGNLLWLMEPRGLLGLDGLAEAIGIRQIDGVLVDANADLRAMLGIKHPAVVPVVDYGSHPITQGLRTHTLFPVAGAITITGTDWQAEPLLQTLDRAWSETGPIEGNIDFDETAGDTAGPLTIGLALTRPQVERTQRIAVIGDSDFLAGDFLGHGTNVELGINLFNWLSEDDTLIDIRPASAPDATLDLDETSAYVIAALFLLVLPAGLLATGIVIWLRRRRR